MLQNIPTHLVAGPLGAGKTSLIRHLLTQKPANERWAILINEFGQIGLDAALLTTAADGIALGEVAGGCLCCVNGAPFQIGLGRLLRKARPDRLFIEPSGLGHPRQLLTQLRQAPWQGVLAVQPGVMVLDAQAMAAGKALPASQQEALAEAGLLVLNKSAGLDDATRQTLAAALPPRPLYWTDQGILLLVELPAVDNHGQASAESPSTKELPVDNSVKLAQMPTLWSDPGQPICLSQSQEEGWSIGWRWHPSQRFDQLALQAWLQSLPWRRAKLVIHSADGWVSGNALDGAPFSWQTSEWRRDSRLELIFAGPQDGAVLQAQLAACRI